MRACQSVGVSVRMCVCASYLSTADSHMADFRVISWDKGESSGVFDVFGANRSVCTTIVSMGGDTCPPADSLRNSAISIKHLQFSYWLR